MMFGKKGKKAFALFVCFLFLLMPVTTAESISEIFGRGVLNFTSQKEELNVNDLAIKLMEAKGDEVLDFLSEPTLLCTKHGSDESLESSSGVYRFACIYFSSKKNELRFSLDNSKFLGFIPSDPDALKLKRNYKNKVAFSVQTSPEFSDRVVFSLFFSSSSADPQLTFSCKKGRIVFLDNMDDFEQFIELMHNYELLLFSKHDFESKTGKEAILNYGLKNIDTNDPNVLRLMKSLTQNNLASLVKSPLYVPTESGIYKFNLMGSMVIVEKNKKIVGTADYVYYLLPGDNPPSSLPTPLSKEKTPTAFFTADEKLTENYLGYYNYEIPSSNFEDNQLTTAGTITGMFIKEKINAFLAWIRNLFAKKASFELVNHTGNETKKLVSLDVYPSSIVNWNKIPPSVLISLEDKMDYYSRYPEKIPLNRDIDLGEGYSIRFLTSSDIEKAEGPTGYAIVAGKEIPDFLEIKGPMEITYASVDIQLQLSSVALKNLGFSEKEITDIVGAGNYITVSISGDSDMVKIGNKELNIDKVLSDKNKIIISTVSNTEKVKGLTLPIIRTEKVGDIEFRYVGGTLSTIDGKFVVPETGYNIYPGDYEAIKNKLGAVFREAQSMKVDLNKIELEGILPDDIKELLKTNPAEIFGSPSDLILIFGAKEMGGYLGLESILPGGKSFIAIKTSDGKTILDTFSTLLHEILHAWKSRSLISQTTILSEINSFTMEENSWEKLAVMGSGDKAYFRMSDETFNGYRHKGADIPYGMRKLYPAYTYIYDTYGDAGVKQLNEILIKKPGLYNFVQYKFWRSFQKAILMTAYNGGSRDEFINLLRKYIKKGIANWDALEFFDNNEIEKFTDDYINYLLKNGKIVSSEAEFNEFIKELKGTDVYEAFSRGMKPGFVDKFLTSKVLEKLKNKKIDEFLWFLYEGKTIVRTDELLKDFKDLKKLSPEKISEFFNLMKKVDVKENRVLYVSFHCDETLKNLAYEVEDGKKFINLGKVKSFIDEDSLGETKIFLPAISKEQDGKLFVYVAEKNRLLVTSKNGREVYFIGKIDLNKELSEPISIKTSDSNNFKLISVETGRAVGFWLSDDNLEVVYSPGKITTSGFKADWKTPKTLSLQDALEGELSCGMYKFKPVVAKEEDLWGAISNPRNWEKEPGIKIWANEKIDEKNFRKLNMQFDEKTKTVTVADTFVVKQMTNEEMLAAAGKDALMEDIFGIEYELHPEKFKTYAEELSVKAENGKIIIEDPHGTGKFAEVSSGGKIEIKFSPKLTGGIPSAVSKAKIGAMKSAAYHYFNTELGKNVPMEKIKINLKNRVAFAPDWTAIKFDDTTYRKVIGFKKPDDVKAEILEKIKPYLERYGFDPEKQKIGLHFETQKVIVYHEYIDPQTGEKIKLGDYDISLETGKVKLYDGAKVDPNVKLGDIDIAGKSRIYTFNYGSNLDGEEVVKNIDGLSANYKKATASGLTREIRSRWNVIPDENGLVKGTVTDISDIGGDWNKMTEFLKKEGAPDGAYNLYRFTKTEDGWKVEKASGPRGKIDKWVETDELKGVNFDIEGVKEGDQVLLFKMNPDGSRIAAEFRSDAVDYYSKCISQMKKVGYTEDDILNEFMKSNFMGVNGDIKFSKLVDDDGKIAYAFFGTKATEGDYYYVYIYKDGKIELKDKWTKGGIRNLQNDGYKFRGTSLKGYAVKETGKVKLYDGAKVDSELEEGFVGFDDADINKKFFPAETVFSSDELKIERAFFTEINGKPFIVSDEAITDTVTGEVYKFIDGKATLDGGDLVVENVDGKLKLNFVGELKVETEVNGVLGINKYGQESLQNFYQKALNSFVEEQGLIFTKEGKIAYIKYLETEGATDMAGGKILEDVNAIIKNYEDAGFKYFGNFHVHFYQEKPSALDWLSRWAEVQSGLEKPYINILYIDKVTKEPTLYIYKMNMDEQKKVVEAVEYALEKVRNSALAIAPESSFEKVNEVSPTNGECKILSDNPISVKISYKDRSDLFIYSPEEFKAKFGVEPPGIDQVKNMKLNDVFGIQTPKEVFVIRTDDKIVFFKDGKEGTYIKPSKEVWWVEPSEPGKIKLDDGKIVDLTDSSNPKVIEPIKPVTEPKSISEPITGVSDQKPFFEGWGDKFSQFSGKMKRGISYLFSGTKSIAGKGKAVGGSIANKINLETLQGNQLKEMAAAVGVSPFAKGEIKPFTYKTEITIGDTKYKLTFYPKKGELILYDNVKITGNVEIDGKATKFEIYGDKIKLSNDIKDLSEIGNLNEYKFSDVQIHLGDDGVINLNNGKFSDLWKELRKPGKRIWKTPSDMAESISLKKLKNLKKYIGKSAGSDALTSLTPYFDKLKSAIKSGNTGSAAKILSSIYNKLLNMPLKVSGGAERFAGVSVSGASKLFSIKTRLNSIFSYVKKMNTLSKQSSSFEVATDLFSKEKVLSNELKLKSSLVTYGLEDKAVKIEFTGTGAVGDIDYKLTVKDGQVRIVGKSGIGTTTFESSTDEIKLSENKFIIGNDEISVKKISNVEIDNKPIDVTTDNPAKLFDELGDIYGKDISKILKESGLEDTALKITFTGADGTKYKLSISDGQVVIRHKGLYGTETWTESVDNVRITKNKLIIGDEEISIDKITNVEAGDSLRNTKPVAVEENDNLEGAVKKLQADYGLPASETKIPTDDKIIFWSGNQFWNTEGEFIDDTKMLYVDENGNLIYKYMDSGVVKTEIAQSVKMDYDGVKIKINDEWKLVDDVKTLNINGVKYSVKDKVIGIISPIDGGGEVFTSTSIKELKSAGNNVEAVFDSEEFFSGISGTMKKKLNLASDVEMKKLSSGDVIVDFKGSNVIDADKMILTGAAESENLEAYAKKITSSLEGSGVLRPRIKLSPDNIQSAVKAYEANDISKFENTDFGKLFKSNSEAYLLLNDNDIIKVAKDDGGLKLLDSDGKFLGNLFVDDEGLKIIKENEVFDLSKLIGGADLKTIKAFSEGTGLGTKFVKNFGPGDFTTMALFAFMAKWSASGVGGDYQKRYFLRQAAYEIPELIPENLAAALAGTNLAVLPVVACEIYVEEVADQVILQNDFKKLTGHDYSELIYEHNPVTEVGKRIKRFVWEPETNNLNDEFTQTVSEILSAKAQSWTKDKINEECLSGKDITVDDIYSDILSHAYGYNGFDFDEITDYISSDEFRSKFNLGDGEIWAKDKVVEIKEPVNLEGIFGDNVINNFVSGMVTPVASLFDRGEETTAVGENLAKSRYALGIDTSLVSSSSEDEEDVQNLLVFAIGDNPDKIWSKYKDEVDKMWSEYGTTKYYDKDAKGEYWEITIDKETGKIIGMDKYEFTVDLPQYNPTSIEARFGQGTTPKIEKPKIKHVSYYGSIFQLADEENKKLADTLNDFMFYGLGDYITSLNTREDVDNVLKEFKDSYQYKSFVENHKDILTTMFGEPDVPDSYIVDQMLEQTKIKLECEALGSGEIIFSDEKIAEALKKADKNNNGVLDADEEEEFKSVLAGSIGQRFTYSFREGYHSLLNTIATFARGSKYHENLKKNQRFGWITDEWENSEGFSTTENLETLDRNLDVLDAYKDVMEIKIHEAKDSLVAIAAEALMNADTDHNGIIDTEEYNNYVTIFNNKCDELLKDINEREGVSVTRGDINNLILKLTSRETNLDNLLFASVRKQLLTDKELISDPEKFKEAVENQFRNNEEKQVQLLGEYYAYLNVNGLISPAEEDYGIDINLLATYISKYISEGIGNGDISNINFEKIDRILAKDPAFSGMYVGSSGELSEKIISILKQADANNDGKLDENEKIYASQCLKDLFQFFDKDSLEGINKAIQKAVTKAMEEHPSEEQAPEKQLPESEKEHIMREKQPKIGKTYETTITTENGNEVAATITYTGKNTYILKYTMNGIQVIDEKGSDYRSIKYSEPIKTTIGIPTMGSIDVAICKIIYKDTNGDGNISIGPQKGKVGDTAYYFTDCGETDLSKAIKIDYHYTNSGLTPSNRYYKAGDWGLTDEDKGKCYGNCYLWSDTSGQGKLYMYGSKGQIIGSCVDKDGDMQCDKDEKGNIDYKPYNTDGDMVLDSSDDDDDGDGYPDIIEVACGSSPNSAGSIPSQDCLSKVSGKGISTGSYEEGNYIIYESVKIEDCDNDGKMEKNIVKQYYNKKTGAKGKTTYTCSPLIGVGSHGSCKPGTTVSVACKVGICTGVMKSTCVSTPYGTTWQDSGNCIVDEKCSQGQTTETTLPSNCRRSCGACSSKGKHYCITYCNGKPVDGSGSWDPCTPPATPSTTQPGSTPTTSPSTTPTTSSPTTSAPSCRISCGAPGSTGKCYCMTICDGKPVDGSGHWIVCPT